MAKEKKTKYTSIGGQAVLEGVMMKGAENTCLAVRKPDGSIETKDLPNSSLTKKYPILGLPILRGVVTFISTLASGYKTLMLSAEMAGIDMEEDESKFDKWLAEKFGDNIMKFVTALAAVLGAGLAVLLFIALPTFLIGLLGSGVPAGVRTLLEGLMKMVIFVIYLALVSRMKEIRRVFEYHGAEHKTIFCYEHKQELKPENVRGFKRFHPRCGTSFLLIVLVISILASSLVSWNSLAIRVLLKFLMLPVVMGLSYEVIRFAGRHDNRLTRAISAPGMWLQRLTTNEPDDSQIEVAIAALAGVLPPEERELYVKVNPAEPPEAPAEQDGEEK